MPEEEAMKQYLRRGVETGMSPQETAGIVFKAIMEERFYIFTHPVSNISFHKRFEDIMQGRNPSIFWE